MPTLTLIKQLRPRFFEGLTPAEITAIIAPALRRTFPAQSVVTHEGDTAISFYLLLGGRARGFCSTAAGDKVPVRWFPPGEIFGGISMLPEPLEYLLSTEAVTNITTLVWDRATIRSLRDRYQRLADNCSLIAYDYLVMYRALLIASRCKTAEQRFASVLANLAKGMGRPVNGGFELDVRNEELADDAGITIFTASRLMTELQRKGFVTKGRGKVLVRSPEALARSAG